jgi:MarR family 2-MHQ and catechol resistance regulon transcriptional repressor
VVDRMITRAPNITRLVDKLEAKGLLARRRCSEDRRVVYLEITEAGLKFVEQIGPDLAEAIRRAMAGLSDRDLQTLTQLLNRLGGAAQPVPESRIPTHNRMESSS